MSRVKKLRNQVNKAWACKDLAQSIDLLSQVIELDRGYLDAYVLRAIRLTQSGKYSDALADLEQAFEIDSTSIKIYFARVQALFKQKEYSQVIEQVTIILQRISRSQELVKPNPGLLKILFEGYDGFKLTTDEKALCYLFRAESIACSYKDYDLSLRDVEKAESLEITKLIRDETTDLKYKLLRKIRERELEQEIKHKSRLSFRLKNSFSSSSALWFWGLSLFCAISAIICLFYGETITAYKLFGLSFLTFPPVIVIVGWVIFRSRPSWNIFKVEKTAYVFSLIVCLVLSYASILSTMASNFGSSPEQPKLSIEVGSDSGESLESMRSYAKLYGGDVYCQTFNGYTCTYTAPSGRSTVIYIDVELTGIGRNPTKGTVTRVKSQ